MFTNINQTNICFLDVVIQDLHVYLSWVYLLLQVYDKESSKCDFQYPAVGQKTQVHYFMHEISITCTMYIQSMYGVPTHVYR